jgi:hypothetical protein
VYPNPTFNELKVVVNAANTQKIQLVVTDLNGKNVIAESKQTISGDNVYSVNVKILSAGTYFIKTICAEGCEEVVEKFVKY